MDDFRIDPTSPYAPYGGDPRPADSNRKKARRPKGEMPEDKIFLAQSTPGDSEAEDTFSVEDRYTPSDKSQEP